MYRIPRIRQEQYYVSLVAYLGNCWQTTKKFVLLTSQTQPQVKQIYDNIKDELESNELLINDFGPFVAEPWNSRTLRVLNYNAQILPVSLGSEIRGIRKRADRPDLVIIDDVDSLSSTRSEDRRNKTINWFDRDIRQIGEKNSSFVIIGNLLHKQCLVSILKKKILDKQLRGEYREYPLKDSKDKCLWKSKYPTKEDLDRLEQSVIVRSTYLREYMLLVFDDETSVLTDSDFVYYDTLPQPSDGSRHVVTFIAIDPALGEKESSDSTAVVSAEAWVKDGISTLYFCPRYVNKRIKPVDTVNLVSEIYASCKALGQNVTILVENTSFQRLLVNLLTNIGINECDIKEISPGGKDKKMRLELVSPYISKGQVMFPVSVFEEPLTELKNVGTGMPDNLADAVVYAISGFSKYAMTSVPLPIIHFINPIRSYDFGYTNEDWADRDDRRLLKGLKTPRRIIG